MTGEREMLAMHALRSAFTYTLPIFQVYDIDRQTGLST